MFNKSGSAFVPQPVLGQLYYSYGLIYHLLTLAQEIHIKSIIFKMFPNQAFVLDNQQMSS